MSVSRPFTTWLCISTTALCAGLGGCFFSPAIDDDGYVACASDDDCGPGFSCVDGFGRCAPPPWNDEEFEHRRLLVVDNPSDFTLPAGAAIPVALGGDDDVLALDDVGPDARFTAFDADSGDWSVVGVYRDIAQGQGLDDDTFVVWIPLQRDLAPGAKDALAFVEQGTAAGTPTVLEDPARVFALFDDLDAFAVDGDANVFVDAPGAAAPVAGDGEVNVGDNTKVVWRNGLAPPLSVTFRARINGVNCEEVFIGLTANDGPSFDPPMAGFFVDEDLLTTAQFVPVADAGAFVTANTPTLIDEVATALHRYTVVVSGTDVAWYVDDRLFAEGATNTAFEPTRLLPTIEVDGDCSIDVDAVWLSPLPTTTPVVRAGDDVLFNPTF
jgi:hypothetical protein